MSNLGANVLHYGTFLDMVHPRNGHCKPNVLQNSSPQKSEGMRTMNQFHPPSSVQVTSQPGHHFALVANFLFF